jgi:uncharacterized membrane protein (DUF373 family)
MEPTLDTSSPRKDRWTRFIGRFERVVILGLMSLLMMIVAVATVELGLLLFKDLSSARLLLLDMEETFDLFGFFLLVLMGLELISSLKSYIRFGVVRGDLVIEVALIAITQKIIILDTSRYGGMSLLGLAALILALAIAFWLVRTVYSRGAVLPSAPDDAQA